MGANTAIPGSTPAEGGNLLKRHQVLGFHCNFYMYILLSVSIESRTHKGHRDDRL